MRDYGLEPLVWGNHNGCEHEWERYLQPSANGQTTHAMMAEILNETSATRKPKRSDFCNCGAWRGSLGLEPTPEMYVSHIVEIFREVKRVLRKDGTLWLNLGDSYCGSWGNYGGQNRGNGKQRTILTGSQAVNPAYEGLESWRPPTTDVEGLKPKDLVGIPWRCAFALQADGWYLRSDIIWSKPNPMPESVTDRPTKSHEYIFLLSKSKSYYYDADAVRERSAEASGWAKQRGRGVNTWKYNDTDDRHLSTGQSIEASTFGTIGYRNIRSVWTITTQPFTDAHFATFPPDLIKPCVLAGAPVGGVVLDPFGGSGTTGKVAIELGRKAVLIEPKAEYIEMIKKRCQTTMGLQFG